MFKTIIQFGTKVLEGEELTFEEAEELTRAEASDVSLLAAFSQKVREKFAGSRVDLCSIINARSGACSEDCAFCAQSAHHTSEVPVYSLIDEEEIVQKAWEMKRAGAHRFDIVTSGLGVTEDEPDFQVILRALRRIKEETGLELCACLGTLTPGAAEKLIEAGVSRYNHNIETAPSFFPQIVSTHSFEERVQTVKIAKRAGMEVCCGGIIGLGESPQQRIEFAFTLKELDVDSIPINILDPRPGTRLANQKPLQPLESIKYLAIFRLILPSKIIRLAGGRVIHLRDLQALGLLAGVNGMLIGNYLTTAGRNPSQDLQMIADLGLEA